MLEFYKDDEKEAGANVSRPKSPNAAQLKDYSREPDRIVSCRNRESRQQRKGILNIADEYEEDLHRVSSASENASSASPAMAKKDDIDENLNKDRPDPCRDDEDSLGKVHQVLEETK